MPVLKSGQTEESGVSEGKFMFSSLCVCTQNSPGQLARRRVLVNYFASQLSPFLRYSFNALIWQSKWTSRPRALPNENEKIFSNI